jgi:hypothetical protein
MTSVKPFQRPLHLKPTVPCTVGHVVTNAAGVPP